MTNPLEDAAQIVLNTVKRDNPSPGFPGNEASELLLWLKRHKVNVNQLVPRNSL